MDGLAVDSTQFGPVPLVLAHDVTLRCRDESGQMRSEPAQVVVWGGVAGCPVLPRWAPVVVDGDVVGEVWGTEEKNP